MRIEGLRDDRRDGWAIASARVVWENCARPPLDLRFGTPEETGERFRADPDAFLIAAAPVAFRDGEARVSVEGSACPILRDGITAALAVLGSWFRPGRTLPRLEATGGFRPRVAAPPRAAVFASAGIDSLFALERNRADHSPDDPERYRDGILFDYASYFEPPLQTQAAAVTERTERRVSLVLRRFGMELLRVRSNFWELAGGIEFVNREAYSAMLAAAAHLFAPRVTLAALAAPGPLESFPLAGTHPLIDPQYSSTAVELRLVDMAYARHEKILRLARSGWALENAIVCFGGPLPEGQLNCGRCEKCLRTMLVLEAIGLLPAATAFPVRRLAPEDVERAPIGHFGPGTFIEFWRALPALLREGDRRDLALAVEAKIAAARRLRDWYAGAGWKGAVRRFDERRLGGALAAARRRWRTQRAGPPPEEAR